MMLLIVNPMTLIAALLLMLMLFSMATSNAMSLSSTTTMMQKRSFQFVNYGVKIDDAWIAANVLDNNKEVGSPVSTISCDGRIEGTTFELTHWTGNTTPDEYYADTSTEMALNFVPTSRLPDAVVVNNHYDTDGVLSCFACLRPELATKYSKALIAGAEAGDFGEWNSDVGVKLDCCLCGLLDETNNGDEALAYQRAFEILPDLLQDLETNNGESRYQRLWHSGWDHACQSYAMFESGRASMRASTFNGAVTIVHEPEYLSGYAIHRQLKQLGLFKTTKRLLRVTQTDSAKQQSQFYYEKPGYGWVQKLVQRTPIPSVDAVRLVTSLNQNSIMKQLPWIKGGPAGLVAICQSNPTTANMSPEQLVELLSGLDEGLRSEIE